MEGEAKMEKWLIMGHQKVRKLYECRPFFNLKMDEEDEDGNDDDSHYL